MKVYKRKDVRKKNSVLAGDEVFELRVKRTRGKKTLKEQMHDEKNCICLWSTTSAATAVSLSEGSSITASAYKQPCNEAPAVPGSNHTDLSISPMHYSPHTAILPPSAPGKDWFHFLFICFHPLPPPLPFSFLSAAFQLN